MGKTVSWFATGDEEASEWSALCPINSYRVISPAEIPSVIPSGLVAKVDSAFVAASGTEHGDILFMLNLNRVDKNAHAVDQEPFSILFHPSGGSNSGCLVHHGDWEGRTSKPPQNFWDAIQASGMNRYYPFEEFPNDSGPLSELKGTSQEGAFQRLIFEYRNSFDT